MKYLIFLFLACQIFAGTYYVDSIAKGKADGSSWANAFPTIKAAYSSVQPYSTVFISGGATGKTQSYNGSSTDAWPGQFFSAKNVTWKIGQDAAHNGTAIFDGMGGGNWLQGGYVGVIISGDAGDGKCHFALKDNSTTDGIGSCNNASGVRFSYIDFGKQPGNSGNSALNFNPGHAVEVDHCIFYLNGNNANMLTYGQFDGTGYDGNSFHDNTVMLPRGTNGMGPDAIGWSGTSGTTGGLSIYNNKFSTYILPSFTGGQHQDGWQGGGGSYIKIYGNTFTDFLNYPIFGDPYGSGYSHVQIYSNTFNISFANFTQAIAMAATVDHPCNDVSIHDNVANGFLIPFTFRNPSTMPLPAAFIKCSFTNNTSYNGGTNIIDPTITQSGNTNNPGTGPVAPPVVVPPVVVPPVVVPPSNPKITTSVSSISADGKTVTTVVTFDQSINQ